MRPADNQEQSLSTEGTHDTQAAPIDTRAADFEDTDMETDETTRAAKRRADGSPYVSPELGSSRPTTLRRIDGQMVLYGSQAMGQVDDTDLTRLEDVDRAPPNTRTRYGRHISCLHRGDGTLD